MKKVFMVAILLFISIGLASAEESFSIGADISEIGDDFSIGGRITSPYLLWGHAAARISGNVAWRETNWTPYGIFRVGLCGRATEFL